jgi:hypothetical protein
MSRGRGLLLLAAFLGILAVLAVFRVRVLVAGGKAALAVLAILVVAFLLWPRRSR